jgi:hypothetical protein
MLLGIFTYCLLAVMHISTHSVHNRILKPWRGRLLCVFSSRHVSSPPLSRLNWCSLTPVGGPGPPIPKMAFPPTGSAHTPSSGSRTRSVAWDFGPFSASIGATGGLELFLFLHHFVWLFKCKGRLMQWASGLKGYIHLFCESQLLTYKSSIIVQWQETGEFLLGYN